MLLFVKYMNSTKKNEGKYLYYLFMVLLVLVCTFRYRVGGDSLHYHDIFDSYPKFSELSSYDFQNSQYNFGWIIFNAAIKSICDSFYFFQFIHAFIINTAIFYFIKKYTINKFLTIIFYLFFNFLYFNMEVLRESLAVSFFLVSIPYLLNKKWLTYYLLCLLAYSFHSSAFILFVLPLFAIEIKVKYQISILILLTLLINFVPIGDLISNYLGFLSVTQVASRNYLNKDINVGGILAQMLKIIPILFIFIIYKRKKLNHQFAIFVMPYLVLGTLSSFIPGVYRFLNYLIIPILIFAVDLCYFFLRRKHKYIFSYYKVVGSLCLLILMQLQYFTRDMAKFSQVNSVFFDLYIPYHSILDEKKDSTREKMFYNSMNIDN
ncbi:EpsG family protein [Chryseobacterium balustinum]|uniref:EpsG family protein n=1 Tax=Chryseobacterium balustinum TaxID=246 RepID=UPI003CEF4F74